MARVVLFLEAGQLLESSHLQEAIRQAGTAAPRSLRERLEEVERREIVRTLARHQGNVSATADELQIGLSTLYRRLRELDVDPQR
jgi:transcriptional regulator with PAS, ATPase and Fis domain